MEISDEVDNTSRRETIAGAVQKWVSQLVDLTGRNRLLFYRTLKRGTLELSEGNPVAVESLLSENKKRLSALLPPTHLDPDRFDEAVKTARSIHRKARELYEERGIETLFVAIGIVSWTTASSSATPAAPLLMAPISLTPFGSGEVDYSLQITGEWRVNDTLILYLRETLGVDIDPEAILTSFDATEDGQDDAFQAFLRQAATVPDVEVADRIVVGTFQYTKLPMVRDLEQHIDLLASNDLIAAIAGDDGAKASLRSNRVDIDPSLPNSIPPSDEFLVLDADSSQNYAINAAVGGESLVVQGPPGTGKSQSIANLIAVLIARGQTVLFVAEKRAAIDAVVKRLNQVGLADSVMDLHGGITSRKELAAALATSLGTIGTTAASDNADLDYALTTARSALVEHADALHMDRGPYDLSVYQAYVRLANLPSPATTDIRFTNNQLLALDAATGREAREHLTEWADLTAPIRSGTSPWGGTNIETRVSADAALDAATEVLEVAATTARDLDHVLDETGLPAPSTLAEWNSLFTTLDDIEYVEDRECSAIFDSDLEDLRQISAGLEPGRHSALMRGWARMFNAEYRTAYDSAREYWSEASKPSGRDLAAVTDRAISSCSGWSQLGGTGRPRLPSELSVSEQEMSDLVSRLQALGAFFVSDLLSKPHREIPQWTNGLVKDQATLFRMPRITELENWISEHGLSPLAEEVNVGRIDGASVGSAFDYAWLQSFILTTTVKNPALAGFDGALLSRRATDYIVADRSHIDQTPRRVQRAIAERAVAARNSFPDEDQTIHGQAKRKRGHLPLRDLFAKTPHVLTSLRPCWTMSPLLVAQVLPAEQVFDVAVFDEASQIRPADAISTILRAKQVIVAGDDRQLPPTAFFDGGDSETDDDEADGLVEGFESILDVLAVLLRNRTLTWHYRSEDERLIAFSNQAFYGGGLTTFPGAAVDNPMTHVLVPHEPGRRVDTRSSDAEVATVVGLMIDHARTRPDETLGAIAMGSHHANRVDAALRQRLEQLRDPVLDEFFSDTHPERAFVKNLERVQGDERDAIILTVGYTKQADGRLLYRFGPLNNKGGERRLNVAVTRARKRVTLVSGFSHTDMEPGRSSSTGVRLLAEYLRYAESGGTDLASAQDIPLNPFELSVLHRLEDAGLQVIPQYGVSGYRIDFAIVDPEDPGKFLLAVEADGASYHSTPTARDRDRLRQQMLERLGWRFHRIWSTDWFRDPEAEVNAVLAAVDASIREGTALPVATHPAKALPVEAAAEPLRGPRPRGVPRGLKIGEYTDNQLVEMVRWIKSDTLLRTDDELVDEMMSELGFRRRGTRIVSSIQRAIRGEQGVWC